MNVKLATWIGLTISAALAVAAITTGILWDASIKPKPLLPEHGQTTSYAVDGIHRLLETAPLIDYDVAPTYTTHIPNADASRFRWRLKETAPRLGWHASYLYTRSDIQLTVPEADLKSVEAMTKGPQRWLLDAMEKPPVSSVDDGPLVNIVIDIDGYHGRHLWPFVPIGFGMAGLIVAISISLTLLMPAPSKNATQPG